MVGVVKLIVVAASFFMQSGQQLRAIPDCLEPSWCMWCLLPYFYISHDLFHLSLAYLCAQASHSIIDSEGELPSKWVGGT